MVQNLVQNSPSVRAAQKALQGLVDRGVVPERIDAGYLLSADNLSIDLIRLELAGLGFPTGLELGEPFERLVHKHRWTYLDQRNRASVINLFAEHAKFNWSVLKWLTVDPSPNVGSSGLFSLSVPNDYNNVGSWSLNFTNDSSFNQVGDWEISSVDIDSKTINIRANFLMFARHSPKTVNGVTVSISRDVGSGSFNPLTTSGLKIAVSGGVLGGRIGVHLSSTVPDSYTGEDWNTYGSIWMDWLIPHFQGAITLISGDADQTFVTSAVKPDNFQTTVITRTSIKYIWDALPSDITILGYHFEWRIPGGEWIRIGTTGTTYTISGLDSRTQVEARVRGYNSYHNGAWTNVVEAVSGSYPAPLTPGNVRVTAKNRTSITFGWDVPTGQVTGYQIHYQIGSEGWRTVNHRVSSRSRTFSNLPSNTEVRFQVRAYNADATGPWSSVVTGTTDSLAAPGVPTGLAVSARTRNSITFGWTKPASSIVSGYNVQIRNNANSAWQSYTTTKLEYIVSSLSANTSRQIRVQAYNADATGPWSSVVTGTTDALAVPGVPTGLAVSSRTRNSITFGWTKPASSTVSGYNVQIRNDANSAWQSYTTTKLEYIVSSLSANTSRQIRVQAYNADATGPWSSVVTGTTDALAVPGVPTGLAVSSRTRNSITFGWTKPASSTVSGYNVQIRNDANSAWQSYTTTKLEYIVSSLSANTSRQIRVQAYNADATGPWSSVVTGTTDALAVPGVPTGLAFSAVGTDRFTVGWSAASGTVIGYHVEFRRQGTSTWTRRTTTSRSLTILNLSPYTTYEVRVRGYNSDNEGAWSDTSNQRTQSLGVQSISVNLTGSGTWVWPEPPAGYEPASEIVVTMRSGRGGNGGSGGRSGSGAAYITVAYESRYPAQGNPNTPGVGGLGGIGAGNAERGGIGSRGNLAVRIVTTRREYVASSGGGGGGGGGAKGTRGGITTFGNESTSYGPAGSGQNGRGGNIPGSLTDFVSAGRNGVGGIGESGDVTSSNGGTSSKTVRVTGSPGDRFDYSCGSRGRGGAGGGGGRAGTLPSGIGRRSGSIRLSPGSSGSNGSNGASGNISITT